MISPSKLMMEKSLLAIVGFSGGSGKRSTVLKLICGLIPFDNGEVITWKAILQWCFNILPLFDL